ncbi:hypothetical protein DIPPA_12361 [Diplonema papillatum]|nr:hypothetical protein DIPPA_12361 [Diplonema papillatum]
MYGGQRRSSVECPNISLFLSRKFLLWAERGKQKENTPPPVTKMPTASPFNGRFSTSPGGMAGGREPSPFDDTPRKQVLTTPSPQAPVYHEQRSAEDIEAHRVYNDGSPNFMGQSPIRAQMAYGNASQHFISDRPSNTASPGVAAGVPSAPKYVGKRIHRGQRSPSPKNRTWDNAYAPGRAGPYGDPRPAFQEGGKGPPPPDGPRRPLGIRRAHVLAGDYAARAWTTSAGAIGQHAPGYDGQYLPESHDARLAKWEKSGDGTTGGWAPPGGWMRDSPRRGGARLPADASVFFNNDAERRDIDMPEPEEGLSRRHARRRQQQQSTEQKAKASGPVDECVNRNTRPRHTLPQDIPARPPGCGVASPAPSRHAWRVPEEPGICSVVDPTRPGHLPRTKLGSHEAPPIISNSYVIFGRDPFSPRGNVEAASDFIASPRKSSMHRSSVGSNMYA